MASPAGTMPGPPTVEQLAQLEHLREVLLKSLTYTSCLLTMLVWDWLVTLPQEIERFWKRKWNFSTYIFFFNRYLGLAAFTIVECLFNTKISYATCLKVVWLEPSMLMAMILAAEVILIMRVWALWDRAIWVPCLFIALLSAEVGISVWAIVGSKPLQIPPQLQMTPCILGGTPSNAERLWLYWLCPVVTDSVIVFLVLLRSYQLYVRAGGAKVPLLTVLVRDGMLFYICVLAANLLNVIWFQTKPVTENQALHAPLAMVVTTIAASRLSLSMRDPVHTEASAASLSKYKTTKASNTMVDGSGFTDKTDGVPTYPLQTLRDTDESKADLEQFDDENEKKTRSHRGDSVNRTPTRDFSNLSVEREPQGYKGVYIQSQIRRDVSVSDHQPSFEKALFR